MSSTPAAQSIASDARWLAQALDPASGLVRLIAMTPEDYRAASFLDDRMLQAPIVSETAPFAEVAAALPADARSDARWIFHIGHVGSTLVSRLLGELEGVLALREPRILRDVAGMPAEARTSITPAIQKLVSRTFAPDQFALIKATSFVSEIASDLVPAGERALFLYAQPRTYIASILAGPNSLVELERLAPLRAQRMAGRVTAFGGWNGPGPACSGGLGLRNDGAGSGRRGNARPPHSLGRLRCDAGRHGWRATRPRFILRLRGASRRAFAKIARGPLMTRYSKALEYEYSPSLRRELIEQELRIRGSEIEEALRTLDVAAKQSPLLASALARR